MYSTLVQEVNNPLYPNDASPCSVSDQGNTLGGPLSYIQMHSGPLSRVSTTEQHEMVSVDSSMQA